LQLWGIPRSQWGRQFSVWRWWWRAPALLYLSPAPGLLLPRGFIALLMGSSPKNEPSPMLRPTLCLHVREKDLARLWSSCPSAREFCSTYYIN
jgi:hypothetical protein